LDLADVFFFEEIFPIMWLASYNDDWPSSSHISDWLLGESRHFSEMVSRQYAMAYDTRPHE
jgi:hypothetical protein